MALGFIHKLWKCTRRCKMDSGSVAIYWEIKQFCTFFDGVKKCYQRQISFYIVTLLPGDYQCSLLQLNVLVSMRSKIMQDPAFFFDNLCSWRFKFYLGNAIIEMRVRSNMHPKLNFMQAAVSFHLSCELREILQRKAAVNVKCNHTDIFSWFRGKSQKFKRHPVLELHERRKLK